MLMSEYLKKTESAVRMLFEGMGSYTDLLRGGMIRGPVGVYANNEGALSAGRQWAKKNKELVSQKLAKQREYMAEHFPLATLRGAVLQIADKGIEICSTNRVIPEEWQESFASMKPTTIDKLVRYCCGRPVREIPIGLVILAGRNQYAHYETGCLNQLCAEVFRRMAQSPHFRSRVLDIVFELAGTSGDRSEIFAATLLHEHGRDSNQAYEEDMLELASS